MTTIYIFIFLVIILFCAIYFYFFSQKNKSNTKQNNNLDDVVSVEKKDYENEPDYIEFQNLINRLKRVKSDGSKGYTLIDSADEVISNIIETIKDKKYSKYYRCQNSHHYSGEDRKDLFLQPCGDIECGSCAIGLSGTFETMEYKLRGFKLNQFKLDELIDKLYKLYIDKTHRSSIDLIRSCEQKMSEIIDEIDKDYSTYLSCSICTGRSINLFLSIKDYKNSLPITDFKSDLSMKDLKNNYNYIKCDKCFNDDSIYYVRLTKPCDLFKK